MSDLKYEYCSQCDREVPVTKMRYNNDLLCYVCDECATMLEHSKRDCQCRCCGEYYPHAALCGGICQKCSNAKQKRHNEFRKSVCERTGMSNDEFADWYAAGVEEEERDSREFFKELWMI